MSVGCYVLAYTMINRQLIAANLPFPRAKNPLDPKPTFYLPILNLNLSENGLVVLLDDTKTRPTY